MVPTVFLLHIVLPAMGMSLLTLAPIFLLRRKTANVRMFLPALSVGITYLVGYLLIFGLHRRSYEVWQAMLPAAIVATIGATALEIIPARRWLARLPLFAVIAATHAWIIMPRPAAGEPRAAWYVAGVFGASFILFAAVRCSARMLPPVLPPLAACLAAFAGGFLFVQFGTNGLIAQPLLLLSVPLGALAVCTYFRAFRDIAAAGVTTFALIFPGVLALGYFYNDPPSIVPERLLLILAMLVAAPLAVVIGLLPALRSRPWLSVAIAIAGVIVLLAGVLALAAGSAAPPMSY